MRYTLEDGRRIRVTKVVVDDEIIYWPDDALVDVLKAGYPYIKSDAPTTEDELKQYVHSYELVDNVIVDVWTLEDKSPEQLVKLYKSKIADLNKESIDFKENGEIEYVNGKKYIPRWVCEFYNTMLIMKDMNGIFPAQVACTDGSTDTFTYEEFLQLYGFIITEFTEYTTAVNAKIAEYNNKIKELEN